MVCALMACYNYYNYYNYVITIIITCWKAPSVEAVGKVTSGPRRVVGEIASYKVDYPIIQGYIR
jgi:hypothetical protein